MQNPAKPVGAQHFVSKQTGYEEVQPFGRATLTGGDMTARLGNDYHKKANPGEATGLDLLHAMTLADPARPKRAMTDPKVKRA